MTPRALFRLVAKSPDLLNPGQCHYLWQGKRCIIGEALHILGVDDSDLVMLRGRFSSIAKYPRVSAVLPEWVVPPFTLLQLWWDSARPSVYHSNIFVEELNALPRERDNIEKALKICFKTAGKHHPTF